MNRRLRIVAMAPAFNEELKIGEVVRRTPRDVVDEVLIIDDGSTDGTAEVARGLGATVIIASWPGARRARCRAWTSRNERSNSRASVSPSTD